MRSNLCGKIGIMESRFAFRMETLQSEHMSDHNPRKIGQKSDDR